MPLAHGVHIGMSRTLCQREKTKQICGHLSSPTVCLPAQEMFYEVWETRKPALRTFFDYYYYYYPWAIVLGSPIESVIIIIVSRP